MANAISKWLEEPKLPIKISTGKEKKIKNESLNEFWKANNIEHHKAAIERAEDDGRIVIT